MAQLLPSFVDAKDNLSLMEMVTKEDLKVALHSFQKDKSSGRHGWSIEFFLGLFDLIGGDLLKYVEDTRISGGSN